MAQAKQREEMLPLNEQGGASLIIYAYEQTAVLKKEYNALFERVTAQIAEYKVKLTSQPI